MNGDYYPKSASIENQLGQQFEAAGDKAKALQHYKQALEKDPNNQLARTRIAALEKQ